MSPFAFSSKVECPLLPFAFFCLSANQISACKLNLPKNRHFMPVPLCLTEEPTFHACPFVPPPLNIARAARITSYAIPAAAVERVYRQLRSQDAGK
jgi:hypothetical protein